MPAHRTGSEQQPLTAASCSSSPSQVLPGLPPGTLALVSSGSLPTSEPGSLGALEFGACTQPCSSCRNLTPVARIRQKNLEMAGLLPGALWGTGNAPVSGCPSQQPDVTKQQKERTSPMRRAPTSVTLATSCWFCLGVTPNPLLPLFLSLHDPDFSLAVPGPLDSHLRQDTPARTTNPPGCLGCCFSPHEPVASLRRDKN